VEVLFLPRTLSGAFSFQERERNLSTPAALGGRATATPTTLMMTATVRNPSVFNLFYKNRFQFHHRATETERYQKPVNPCQWRSFFPPTQRAKPVEAAECMNCGIKCMRDEKAKSEYVMETGRP
jgi:hypothetical protein